MQMIYHKFQVISIFMNLICENDEDFFHPRRHQILPILFSHSKKSDNEEVEWSERHNPPIIEQFFGQSGVVEMPNNASSVVEVDQLFIGNTIFLTTWQKNKLCKMFHQVPSPTSISVIQDALW